MCREGHFQSGIGFITGFVADPVPVCQLGGISHHEHAGHEEELLTGLGSHDTDLTLGLKDCSNWNRPFRKAP